MSTRSFSKLMPTTTTACALLVVGLLAAGCPTPGPEVEPGPPSLTNGDACGTDEAQTCKAGLACVENTCMYVDSDVNLTLADNLPEPTETVKTFCDGFSNPDPEGFQKENACALSKMRERQRYVDVGCGDLYDKALKCIISGEPGDEDFEYGYSTYEVECGTKKIEAERCAQGQNNVPVANGFCKAVILGSHCEGGPEAYSAAEWKIQETLCKFNSQDQYIEAKQKGCLAEYTDFTNQAGNAINQCSDMTHANPKVEAFKALKKVWNDCMKQCGWSHLGSTYSSEGSAQFIAERECDTQVLAATCTPMDDGKFFKCTCDGTGTLYVIENLMDGDDALINFCTL